MTVLGAYLLPHPPLIVPEVGNGQELVIAATVEAYERVAREISEIAPELIIVFSPHSTVYRNYIHISPGKGAIGSLHRFGATCTLEAAYDTVFTEHLSLICSEMEFPAGIEGVKNAELDHATYIPLHFINRFYSPVNYRIARISPSGLSEKEHYAFGKLVQKAAAELGKKTVVIASGDLSHMLKDEGPYGYAKEGPLLDKSICEVMRSGEFGKLFEISPTLREKGAECGFLPIMMMAGALDGLSVKQELLSYEGPFGVGYAVARFEVTGKDNERKFLNYGESMYVRLARETLESYVEYGIIPEMPAMLPEKLKDDRAGVFVSIKKFGELRGCIGTISPTTDSVANEIRQNAVSSGTQDPRFPPVTARELDYLSYSVDVLHPAERCTLDMLDPERYGVIVTAGYKRGLLLPMLDGVETVEEQVRIAKGKAGIHENDDYTLERFEVVRYK